LEQRATHISEPYERHRERAAPLPLRTQLIRPLPRASQPAFAVWAPSLMTNLQRFFTIFPRGRWA
jgi:hypothetical protein